MDLSTKDCFRLRAFFEKHHTKAVLAEFGPMGCLLARACDEANVPLYVHFHGYDASELLRVWCWLRYYKVLFQKAAGMIAPTRFLANALAAIGCPERKLHICPCGVDAQRFRPGLRVGQRVLAVGRFVQKKAPH